MVTFLSGQHPSKYVYWYKKPWIAELRVASPQIAKVLRGR